MTDKNRNVNGILCLNKPSGVTSHDMVGKVRRLYSTRKVGHTGTLDPMATGVLVMLIGRAAKASDFLLAESKEYRASIKLGIKTDTLDITGNILRSAVAPLPCLSKLLAVLPHFTGEQTQIPPMYSAIKQNGQKLYELARRGITVEREERQITVNTLEYIGAGDTENEYILRIVCSKGTYIRTLCADIGDALGCGAVMSKLCRVRNGAYTIEQAISSDELETMTQDERDSLLTDIESAFPDYLIVFLPAFYEKLARCGNEIYLKKLSLDFPEHTMIRLYGSGAFFAIGEVLDYPEGKAIKPVRQFDLQ